jgi:hypothetical protein
LRVERTFSGIAAAAREANLSSVVLLRLSGAGRVAARELAIRGQRSTPMGFPRRLK